jgi:hypothetical protein
MTSNQISNLVSVTRGQGYADCDIPALVDGDWTCGLRALALAIGTPLAHTLAAAADLDGDALALSALLDLATDH